MLTSMELKTTRKRGSEALEAINTEDDISPKLLGQKNKRFKMTPTSSSKDDQIKSNGKFTISISSKTSKKTREEDKNRGLKPSETNRPQDKVLIEEKEAKEIDCSKKKSVVSNKTSKVKTIESKKGQQRNEVVKIDKELKRSEITEAVVQKSKDLKNNSLSEQKGMSKNQKKPKQRGRKAASDESLDKEESKSKSKTLILQKLDLSNDQIEDDLDDKPRQTKVELRPQQEWDPFTYFKETAQSVTSEVFDDLIWKLHTSIVELLKVTRRPKEGKYEPVYVKDTYDEILIKLLHFFYEEFPNIRFSTMYGVEFPSLMAIKAKNNEQDLNFTILLNILSNNKELNPIFVMKIMNKPVNQQSRILKTYFQTLGSECVCKKFYGIIVDSKEMIFVRYDENLYQSKAFPVSLKEEFLGEKEPSNQLKKHLNIIICMIIKSIQEVNSTLEL